MKTLIAIPCMDNVPTQFAQSLLWLEKGDGVSVMFRQNSLIYDSRNLVVVSAIEQNFDRIMWFDSDMIFHPKTMKMLMEDMDSTPDCEMVSGLYFMRKMETAPVIYDQLEEPEVDEKAHIVTKRVHNYFDYPEQQLFPVKACGFGCCLTSVKLCKAVWDEFGPAFSPITWAGEDLAFCYRVNQLGYQIWCDSRIMCGHIGQFVYTDDFYKVQRGDRK